MYQSSQAKLLFEKSKFQPNLLSKFSEEGSYIAQTISLTKFYSQQALLFLNQGNATEFIRNFDRAVQLEHSAIELPVSIMTNLGNFISQILKQSANEISDFNQAIRNCLLFINLPNHQFCLEFASSCLEKYPKNSNFFVWKGIALNFMDRRKEGLVEFDNALKLDPENIEILYHKAATLRYIDDKFEEALKTYEIFLLSCPKDHRKIPECYYAMSTIYLMKKDMLRAKNCYESGISQEKVQLPFFVPYVSNGRDHLKKLFT